MGGRRALAGAVRIAARPEHRRTPAWGLRPLTHADRAWAYQVHRAALGEYVERTWGWDEDLQQRLFAEGFGHPPGQAIQVGGEDVGVLVVDERPAEIYIGLLELLPGWQGRGLGAAIVGELRERARASGRALTLHVLPVNARAVAFYERCGLRVVASEPTRLAMRAEA